MKKTLSSLLAVATLVGLSATGSPVANARPVVVAAAPGDVADYIVRFNKGTNISNEVASHRRGGLKVKRSFNRVFPGAVMNLNANQLAALQKNPQVQSIEVDAQVTITDTQNGATWGLDRIDQNNLPLSGSFTWNGSGTGVTAYIVDTGILAAHNEFGGRVASGFNSVSDTNGTNDCNGHGTHVAGTVGGSKYGVAKNVTLVPVRVLGCTGSGSLSGVIAGLDWIVAHHQSGVPAVANMSLGSGASSAVDAAVQAVIDDGVTVAVAAGNSNLDACTASPARAPGALTVAATTSTDARASYSNFGTCVDLFAPGSSITSAWSTSTTATNTISGTSMASPHVAGAVAALLSLDPTLTPTGIASALLAATTSNVVSSAGAGSPNRLLFLDGTTATPPPSTTTTTTTSPVITTTTTPTEAPVTTTTTTAPPNNVTTTLPSATTTTTTPPPTVVVPDAPTAVTATAGRRSATIAWTQGFNGGSALTSQTITAYRGNRAIGTVRISGTATKVTITGLSGKTAYSFTVKATNSAGTGPESAKSNVVTVLR